MIDTKDNKSFNQLVHYIDHDLLDVLTEDQRDTIYALAASSIALKERHSTLEERSTTAVSALNREGMDFGTPEPDHGVMSCFRKINPIYVLFGMFALIAILGIIY